MTLLSSAYFILVLIAFGLTLVSGITGKVPLWIPVLLITIAMLITTILSNESSRSKFEERKRSK